MKYYEIDFKISAPNELMQDACDLLAALTGEAGLETFEETETGVKGYVQQALFDNVALNDALADFPFENVKINYSITEAEDKDWNEQWENEGFEPIVIGNKCVVHDGRHLPQGEYDINIEIDAKLAFGTGTHETTRMVVASLLDMQLEGKTLLDCGCGTGILGIVALKAGACHATGYDIDEWSTSNSLHNAIINYVDDRYEVMLGDASVLNTIDRQFDVVVANINRNILLADMPQFKMRMKPGATLVLSGFYEEDTEIIKQRAKDIGLKYISMKNENNWACLMFTLDN
ncbi:MAG: 50S ribosomal protein L11 methyltransferase [Prevotella sp.]|nr:50S ribosomal protein L11 methyltransferase [Prevotella sp.]